jgi:excisionase family DNA binding protein
MPDPTSTTPVTEHPGTTPLLALRPKDAARVLGIGERKLWELTNRRMIPHLRLGKAIVYPIADLERWLAEQAAKGMRR